MIKTYWKNFRVREGGESYSPVLAPFIGVFFLCLLVKLCSVIGEYLVVATLQLADLQY